MQFQVEHSLSFVGFELFVGSLENPYRGQSKIIENFWFCASTLLRVAANDNGEL